VAKTHNATKILFISSWFPNRVTPLNGDFVERHALAVSRICRTAVIHVMPDTRIHGRFMEIYEIQKRELFEVIIYFRKISGKFFLARLFNLFMYGLGYFIGFGIVKREMGTPDVIHANIIPVSRIALLIHRFTRIPYIISEHWTIFLGNDRNKIQGNFAKPVSKAFALVPVSGNLKDAMISSGFKGRYFVVPNVVDTVLFNINLNATPGRKRMLHVSSMKEDHKNILGIIRAVRFLREMRDDFEMTFVGDATPVQKNLVSQTGLSDCVIFTGEVEHSKVAGYMKHSDMLVMFSNWENLPCVILEAFSCGLPVISTRVGGIPEWLNDENGILIDPGDEKGLCDGMNYLLDHYQEYDKEQLHQYAVRNFSPEVIASKFLDIYTMALNNTKE